jgi:hypothetical protein
VLVLDHAKASGVNSTVREIGLALGTAAMTAIFVGAGGELSPDLYVDAARPAVLVGAAVLVEYQLVLAALVLGLFLCVRDRRAVGWLAVGGAPFAVALMAYQRAAFGGLLSTSYAQKDVHTTTVAGWPHAGCSVVVVVWPRALVVTS